MTRGRGTLLVAGVLIGGLSAYAFTPPRGERSMRRFDAARMADLETSMWQAYYAKERAHRGA
jgi:hypothetical protein